MEERMAKIKVHELAKELDMQSKDILGFLQAKGIEAKAAQSSVEETAADMVRKEFGKSKPAAAPKEEVKAAAKEETPEVKSDVAAGDAPKKKKNIIFVSNPQNSKMPGQHSQNTQNRNGVQQQRPQNNGGRVQQPVRPIKPLTPPSPTPSVQMVPDTQKQVRHNGEGREQERTAAQAPQQTQQAVQAADTQASAAQQARPQQNRPYRDNRNQEGRSYDNRSQENRGFDNRGPRGNRPQGDRPQSDRPVGNRGTGTGYQNRTDRPQGNRFQSDRPQSDRPNNRFGRPGEGNQGERRGPYNGDGQGRSFGNRDNKDGRGSFGNRDFGGRVFDKDRDSRDGRDNRSGGFRDRDNKPSKSFGGDAAPAKDIEKKREEDKRRLSQEKDKRSKKDFMYEEDESVKNKPGRFIKPEKKKEEVVEEAIKVIILPETITIKDLADKMKMQPSMIVKKLFLQGKIVNINQEVSYEEAEEIAMEYEILCEKEVKVDVIEELLKEEEEQQDNLVERPPVICVMGHVDHGKTSLLDAIRKTNVTDREAGGITQHIGAYTVTVGERKITFLDTPGHEAFTAMRMRGANATDIAILVVAADDGVMPQTIEAINHAKAAGIEIIVAVNKIDKPSANIERVKQELTEYELISTDWGGTTEFVPVSAKSGEGIENLLETILLTADILELKANPERRARGLVIEAELDKGRGPVATILVQKGTLHVGDFISAGACHGKVRAMIDDKGRRVKEAGPSEPVEILGLSDVPSAGEVFIAHDSDKTAKNFADTYLAQNKAKMLEETKQKMSLDDLFSQIKEGNLKELNLIVKADVQGSVEAVKQSLMKLSNEEVVVKCIHGGVGAINESDVTLASASNAIIIGFNIKLDATAKATAEREGVDVRLYKVIYQAIEDVEAAMKGMLDPVYEEKIIGHAEVRQIFKASAIGNIAGSYVLDGMFQRGCKVRITREGEQIFEGELASLKRFKDDVKEVKAGFECGLVFEGYDQMQELDIVEAYIMVEVPR